MWIKFYFHQGPEILNKYIGASEQSVRELLKELKLLNHVFYFSMNLIPLLLKEVMILLG